MDFYETKIKHQGVNKRIWVILFLVYVRTCVVFSVEKGILIKRFIICITLSNYIVIYFVCCDIVIYIYIRFFVSRQSVHVFFYCIFFVLFHHLHHLEGIHGLLFLCIIVYLRRYVYICIACFDEGTSHLCCQEREDEIKRKDTEKEFIVGREKTSLRKQPFFEFFKVIFFYSFSKLI